MLEKRRVVGARPQRADTPVGTGAYLLLVLRLRAINRTRLLSLPDRQVRFRIGDVPRHIVDEMLERVRALHLEEAASVAVRIQIRDRVLLQFGAVRLRSEEHTSELQSRSDLVCRLL